MKIINMLIKSPFSILSHPKHKLSFILDIDGVLIKSRKPIPRAKQAIQLIQKHNIPFLFFTNNLSKSQSFKAQQLTNYLTLDTPIKGQQVVLNYTPIRKSIDWKGKLVLIIGRPQLQDILPLDGIENYITITEYVSMFSQCIPFVKKDTKSEPEVIERVCKRLNMQSIDIHQLKFDMIFILCVPIHWQQSIQVIIDILSTPNGYVSKQRSFSAPTTHIAIFVSFNDLLWRREDHNLPRFLMRPFTISLQSVFKQIYHKELEITAYGKPSRYAFEYAHKHIDELYGESQKYVMIGDNQEVDIKGANEYGWESVLVLSGVTTDESKRASKTCVDVEEGVRWAIKEFGGE